MYTSASFKDHIPEVNITKIKEKGKIKKKKIQMLPFFSCFKRAGGRGGKERNDVSQTTKDFTRPQ